MFLCVALFVLSENAAGSYVKAEIVEKGEVFDYQKLSGIKRGTLLNPYTSLEEVHPLPHFAALLQMVFATRSKHKRIKIFACSQVA